MVKTSLADIWVLFTGRDANCQNKVKTFLLGLTCVVIPKYHIQSFSYEVIWSLNAAHSSLFCILSFHGCSDKNSTLVSRLQREDFETFTLEKPDRAKEQRDHCDTGLFLALYFYVHITGSSWNNFGKIYTVYKSILQCNISDTWRTASFDIMVQFRFENYFSIRLNFVTVDICLILVFVKYVSVY